MAWWLGLADLEPGDRFGGGAGDLGEQFVGDVDPQGVVGGLDGDGAAGVDHADVDPLSGNDDRPAAADSPVDPQRFGRWLGSWPGGACVTDTGQLRRGERVGQAAQ